MKFLKNGNTFDVISAILALRHTISFFSKKNMKIDIAKLEIVQKNLMKITIKKH